jgi:hypothetical protein
VPFSGTFVATSTFAKSPTYRKSMRQKTPLAVMAQLVKYRIVEDSA